MNTVARILIVDDLEANRNILYQFSLLLGHTPILAENGRVAIAKIEAEAPDLILLDILMPDMDGYMVLDWLKNQAAFKHIPVIMISAVDDVDSVVQCIQRGADDYLIKPFNRVLLRARVHACLERKRLRDQEEEYRSYIENYNVNLKNLVDAQVKTITSAQHSTIFAMAKLAESRDPETGQHLQRMAEYCRILAEKIIDLPQYAHLGRAFVDDVYAASPLHDIGKVGIPDRILQKPAKLTPDEFAVMRAHPIIGANTLREVYAKHPDNLFIQIGIEIAESHHERWDGMGYPYGLKGINIPLAGRILALGDVYDALTSRRCYKEPFAHNISRDMIVQASGTHFDPDVVEAFLASEKAFLSIYEKYQDF